MRKVLPLFLILLASFGAVVAAGNGEKDVKLIYAEGRIYYHEIYVTWSTEFESRPCDFILEASENKEDWRIRGRVKSHGSASQHAEYKFIDAKDSKFRFYRIRKLDSQGNNGVLSEFELENYSINVELEALQLPDARRLVLEYSIDKDQELMIRIYNRIGEQVLTRIMPFRESGDYIYHLDISELKRDNYLLQVTQVLLDKVIAEQAFKVD